MRVTFDVIFIKTIATDQSARGNFDSYCRNQINGILLDNIVQARREMSPPAELILLVHLTLAFNNLF